MEYSYKPVNIPRGLIAHTYKKVALAAVRVKAVVLMLMIHYKLLLQFCGSLVFGFCFVVQ